MKVRKSLLKEREIANLEREKKFTSSLNNDGGNFPPIMGEKEFFDVMKNANRLLTMEERFLISQLINAFTRRRD